MFWYIIFLKKRKERDILFWCYCTTTNRHRQQCGLFLCLTDVNFFLLINPLNSILFYEGDKEGMVAKNHFDQETSLYSCMFFSCGGVVTTWWFLVTKVDI